MPSSNEKKRKNFDLTKYMVYIIFVAVILIFLAWLGTTFFSVSNLLNVVRQSSSIAIMAVSLTFVLATGGIDLTISGIIPFSCALAAMLMNRYGSIMLALILMVLMASGIGLINGLCITKIGMPPFIVTLGMQFVLKGAAMWVTHTQSIPVYLDRFNKIFGNGYVGPVPGLLIWMIVFLIIGHIALRYLPYGKKILAVGGNKMAAKYTGINVDRVTVTAYIVSAIVSVFGGFLYMGRISASRYNLGDGVEMDVVASVVLGGTAMAGGNGNVIGSVVGALLIGLINNGLIIGGLDVSQQQMVKGLIIIGAVAINNIATSRKRS